MRPSGHPSQLTFSAMLAGLLLLVASSVALAGGAVTASYVATLGGPGHAGMYPSGMEIVPTDATTTSAGTAGDVVVADTGNDRVAEYTTSGSLVWQTNASGVANEGSSATCGAKPGFPQFEQPRDVGVDASGNVYVADNGNGRIVVLNATTGKCLLKPFKMVGGGAPIGVTVSATPSGQLVFVANGTHSQVQVFTTAGAEVETIVSQGACTINNARDAAADSSGDIYVANYKSNDILEFSSSGTCIRSWGTHGKKDTGGVCNGNGAGTFANPYGVAVGTDPYINGGNPGEAIYVADSNDDCLQEFTPNGTWVAQVGSPGANTVPGTFTQLRRVAVDAHGNLWGADLWGNRVEEFTRTPSGYTYAETIPNPVVPPGDTSTSIYNQVRGISFDSSGDVVSMDTVNQRVVVMSSTGTLIGTCGQRGFTSTGDFNWPRGVAVDPVTGDYWIADTKQSDLQILEPLSDSCTGVAEFGSEGTAAGDLDYPYSIAIGGGYAWVADTKNNRIEAWNVATCTADAGTCKVVPGSPYGTKGSGTGQFSTPTGIAVDPTTGNVFVADSGNGRVVELSVSGGTVTGVVRTFTGLTDPYGVAANGTYVAVAQRADPGQVVVFNEPSGTAGVTITGGDVTGGGPTTLYDPENVAFGPNGDLYIADTYNDRILGYSLSS
jgi:DNA-binding beta-propeller fold protein YncE